jgi:hypothetical protein
MHEDTQPPDQADADYVDFVASGTTVVGAYHCADCGYGVTLRAELPVCPMCSGKTWEPAPWSPFRRARALH